MVSPVVSDDRFGKILRMLIRNLRGKFGQSPLRQGLDHIYCNSPLKEPAFQRVLPFVLVIEHIGIHHCRVQHSKTNC